MGKAVSQTDGFNELRGMPASEKSCLILMLLASWQNLIKNFSHQHFFYLIVVMRWKH